MSRCPANSGPRRAAVRAAQARSSADSSCFPLVHGLRDVPRLRGTLAFVAGGLGGAADRGGGWVFACSPVALNSPLFSMKGNGVSQQDPTAGTVRVSSVPCRHMLSSR